MCSSQSVSGPLLLAALLALLQTMCAGHVHVHHSRRALRQFARWGPRWPLQVNAVLGYWAAPRSAGSVSLAGDAKGEVFKDGTIKAGVGLAASTAMAVGLGKPGNREVFGIGNPRYDRPFVATQAYVTVPRLLGWTTFPTLGYNLAEGRGSAWATSNGYFAVGEVAYNGLSNSFGVTLSQAQAGSASFPAAVPGSALAGEQGFNGLEQVGAANSLTLFTDPRTIQFAQSVAYPTSLLTPGTPITCTQTLINTAVATGGDFGGPVRPTPRAHPLFLIPFCVEFFNFNTLDNFHLFIQDYIDAYYDDGAAYYDAGLPGDLLTAAKPDTHREPSPRTASTPPACKPPDTSAAILRDQALVQAPHPALAPMPAGWVAGDTSQRSAEHPNITTFPRLPRKYATSSLRAAQFGASATVDEPFNLATSGAELWAPREHRTPTDDTAAPCPAPGRGTLVSPSAMPARNTTRKLKPLGPALFLARSPSLLLPLTWRQEPEPRTQDVNALVALGQVVSRQLEQLPAGRLARGVARMAAGAAGDALGRTAAEVTDVLRQAWNVSNQAAHLRAQVALNMLLASAGAALPLTRFLHNQSSAWYNGAAAVSNRAVDRAIQALGAQAGTAGNMSAAAAGLLQDLTARALVATAKQFGRGQYEEVGGRG